MCAMASALRPFLFLFLWWILTGSFCAAHNITTILDGFPKYRIFNNKLTETKLADEINTRKTITVLALSNSVMASLASSAIKNGSLKAELSLHVLLDYFDHSKLHNIANNSALITTLYQTTGLAINMNGFVNITVLKGGNISFRSDSSTAPDKNSSTAAYYVTSIKQIPYNISVIEISAPIVAAGIDSAAAPSASEINITAALVKNGCKTFASLLTSTGVITEYESAVVKNGLTVFAPKDEAFKTPRLVDLGKMSEADMATLMRYHALDVYLPIATLKMNTKRPIRTMASYGTRKFNLMVSTDGDEVTLHTGVNSSRIDTTMIDSTPLCIFTVGSVLLSPDLSGKSPSPSPEALPGSPPATRVAPSPAQAPPPKTVNTSPPTPSSASTPEGSPADAPGPDSADSTSAVTTAAPALGGALVVAAVSAAVIFSFSLS